MQQSLPLLFGDGCSCQLKNVLARPRLCSKSHSVEENDVRNRSGRCDQDFDMRPVCFHQPCKIDPVNRAGSPDIREQKGSLFGALCDDIESLIGPLHAFDFKAGS